ncbi:MAG: glycosyltransferase family 2 protein [Elusimicrobiota bacterium]|jgi:glycosyltransferase involved in cell wall biosynthesis|nr:glycosyltransferase family 2 protein [Elusimicrobiota bacterium]
MKLFIAVPVYNRKEYLEITARSLFECSNINKAEIVVFNDSSDEFDTQYLHKIFHAGNVKIISAAQKIDIDVHYYEMMKTFLASDSDVLMICDSDLLLRSDTIDYVLNNFSKTDGFLGLYNSDLHRDLYFDGEFVYKEDVGFAGICVSKKVLQSFIAGQDPKARAIDFKFSDYLLDNNIRIMVAKNCLIQHIGFNGEHCNDTSVEFSSNFVPNSEFNKEVISKLMPIALKMQSSMIKHLLFCDKYRRHGFFVHQPHKYLAKERRVKELMKYYEQKYPITLSKGKENGSF